MVIAINVEPFVMSSDDTLCRKTGLCLLYTFTEDIVLILCYYISKYDCLISPVSNKCCFRFRELHSGSSRICLFGIESVILFLPRPNSMGQALFYLPGILFWQSCFQGIFRFRQRGCVLAFRRSCKPPVQRSN